MSPQQKEQDVYTAPITEKIAVSAKKFTTAFFEKPIDYIFYGSLIGIIIGLFFGVTFSWILYAIVSALTIIKLYGYYKKNS